MNIEQMINSNNKKVFIYMFIMTFIIGILGHIISSVFDFGLTGTGIFLIIAGIIDFVAYYFSDTFVLKSCHAIKLEKETLPEYFDLVYDLCSKNNIKMPKLYLLNEESINAFATGRNIDKAVVAITKGALEKLTPDEIRGVIAHELSHVESNDVRLMAVISVLAGIISIFADMYFVATNSASERDRSGIIAIIGLILALFAPLTALFIKMAISRQREYVADARGAMICGNSDFLADALSKIKNDRIPLTHTCRATSHLYISSPYKGDFIENLMSTHPNTDERIQRLRNMQLRSK